MAQRLQLRALPPKKGVVQVVMSLGLVHPVAHAGWQPVLSHASPYLSPSRLAWLALGTRGQLSTLQWRGATLPQQRQRYWLDYP